MGKRKHLEQFGRDVRGNYIYEGDHFTLAGPLSRSALLGRLWLAGGGMVALELLSGCVGAAGMQNAFYVILPWAAGLLFSVSLCWALGSLWAEGERVRDYVFQKTAGALPRRGLLAAICAGAAAVGQWIFLFLTGVGRQLPGTILFQLSQLSVIALALFLRRTAGRAQWERQKGAR